MDFPIKLIIPRADGSTGFLPWPVEPMPKDDAEQIMRIIASHNYDASFIPPDMEFYTWLSILASAAAAVDRNLDAALLASSLLINYYEYFPEEAYNGYWQLFEQLSIFAACEGHNEVGIMLKDIARETNQQGGYVSRELLNFALDNNSCPKRKKGNTKWRNFSRDNTLARQFYEWKKENKRFSLPDINVWHLLGCLNSRIDSIEKSASGYRDKKDFGFFDKPLPDNFDKLSNNADLLKRIYKKQVRGIVISDLSISCLAYWADRRSEQQRKP